MSTTQVQTVASGADKAKLAAAVVATIAAVAAFYLLRAQGAWVQWLVLLLGLAFAAGVFLTTEAGKALIGFGRDAVREVKKVVWPSRKEAIQTTAYVFGFVLLMAIFLWLTDKTLEWVLYDLLLGWKK
ncbi:preprotein translocase subunit SecE [Curvibacter sp. APW13]|uniref:preprotein translocase subunit SecE n=1 Tax=Curvibacter sp. APW13 TaxID=3077236 RepID=UPI0028DED951|nr:preprotein translocase subunit SecE [Curvibacter sp. APW13]MDT8993120.1 preprotein translocase subunit SecE [Curvibacter sp. APW13]